MDRLQEVFEQEFNTQLQRLIDQALDNLDITSLVEKTVAERFDNGNFQQYVSDTIKQHVNQLNISDTAIARLEQRGQAVMAQHMPRVVQLVQDRVDTVLARTVDQKLQDFSFPENSIDPSVINTSQLKLTRENIVDFGTTDGIEDLATNVQLTVMDGCVVIEDSVVARTVTADTLIVKDVATDQPWYTNLKQDILESVPKPEHPKDWSWEIAEVDAKIDVAVKRQGILKELEVSGEALLSDVLYTTPGNLRVGINTMDPSDALTVWDQETEVVIGKHASQEGYIGTRRRQALNIGSNNKVGIKIKPDGTVKIDSVELVGKSITTGSQIPGHAAKSGDIVLNSKPTVGNYVGWVCLDGLKWAGFGRID